MSIIFILIACSLSLAIGFLVAFLWASNSGQFEDDYTPSVRILFEDEDSSSEIHSKETHTQSSITTKSDHTIKSSIHVK